MTAIEWLVDKILVQQEIHTDKEGDWIDIPRINYTNAYKDHVDLIEFVEKAKEMEKQQIYNAFYRGIEDEQLRFLFNYDRRTPEQYYNETFKIKKDD